MTEARTLAAYLLQKRAAMEAAARERPTGADWHETVQATCVADDASGVRKLRIRDWQFVSDSGPGFGGWSLGPSSPELLCGVISTCLTHTYEIGAAKLGVPIERIEVTVTAENNDARFLGIATEEPAVPFNIVATVSLEPGSASAAQVAELHDYARRCPLTNLVRMPNEVRVVVA